MQRSPMWVEFDGIRSDTIEQHVGLVKNIKRYELLERMLLSDDAGW